MLNLGKTLQKFPLKETSPTYKHIWQDLQCSNNHRTSLVLHYSDSLLLTVLQLSSQIQESPYSRISPTFTQRWGGYDECLLFGDNSPDNLPTRGRASISFSSALLLSNTVLERKRQMLLTRIIKQGKDEKHWLTSTAGTPFRPLDMTLGCNSPLPINYSPGNTWGRNYMLYVSFSMLAKQVERTHTLLWQEHANGNMECSHNALHKATSYCGSEKNGTWHIQQDIQTQWTMISVIFQRIFYVKQNRFGTTWRWLNDDRMKMMWLTWCKFSTTIRWDSRTIYVAPNTLTRSVSAKHKAYTSPVRQDHAHCTGWPNF